MVIDEKTCDTTESLVSVERLVTCSCSGCSKKSFLGHDWCFANLPGVFFACCGHGNLRETYISTPSEERLSGVEAFVWAAINRPTVSTMVKTYWHHWLGWYWPFVDMACRKVGYRLVFCLDTNRGKTWHEIHRRQVKRKVEVFDRTISPNAENQAL